MLDDRLRCQEPLGARVTWQDCIRNVRAQTATICVLLLTMGLDARFATAQDAKAKADPWRGGWKSTDTRVLADVNGDHQADIVGFGKEGVWVSLSKKTSFSTPSRWHAAYGSDNEWTTDHIRTAIDVDGDGKADIVGFGEIATYVSLSTGQGFGPPITASTIFCHAVSCGSWQPDNPRLLADVDGDGKPDIIGFGTTATYVALNTSTRGTASFGPPVAALSTFCQSSACGGWGSYPRVAGDVNRDGKADIVGFGSGATYVALSTSTPGKPSFGALTTVPFFCTACDSGWDANYPRVLADFDADGLMDIVGFGRSATFVSRGGSTATQPRFASPVAVSSSFCAASSCGGWGSEAPRTVADVDGDNRPDLVGFADDGVYVSFNEASSQQALANTAAAPRRFTGVYSSGALGFLSNWMTDLYDHIADFEFRYLAIPGAHDSGTYTFAKGHFARNQTLDLHGQLSHGARFLDVRPIRGDDNGDTANYYLHHGGYITNLKLDVFYNQLKVFLDTHPAEVVILHFHDILPYTDSYQTFLEKTIGPIQDRLISPGDILNFKCDKSGVSMGCMTLKQIRALQQNNPKKQIFAHMDNVPKDNYKPIGDLTWHATTIFVEYSDSGFWPNHEAWLIEASKDRIRGRLTMYEGTAPWAFSAQMTPSESNAVAPEFFATHYNDDLAEALRQSDDSLGMKNRHLNIFAADFIEYPDNDIPHAVIALNLVPSRGCLINDLLGNSPPDLGPPGEPTQVTFSNWNSKLTALRLFSSESGHVDIPFGSTMQVASRINVPILASHPDGSCSGVYIPRYGRSSSVPVVLEAVR